MAIAILAPPYVFDVSIFSIFSRDDSYDDSSLDRRLVYKVNLDTRYIPCGKAGCCMCISYFCNESFNASTAVVKLFRVPFLDCACNVHSQPSRAIHKHAYRA